MTDTSFRERLCALRDAAGLCDADVSALCGLSEGAAGHLFTGRRDYPRTETTIALCQLFGCTADYLLRGEGSPEPETVRAAVTRALASNADVQDRVRRRTLRGIDPNAVADDALSAAG